MTAETLPLLKDDRLVMVVGNYGSGKTEVSVNLAIRAAASGRRVRIADLDLVNPYFRCREARRLMEAHGISVVVPPGAQAWADLPIVVPEVLHMLSPPAGTLSLFDVGGDDVGARVLGSLRGGAIATGYELWQVINPQRPFTRDADGCLAMREAIERSSRLVVTGLVVNAHLMEETTADTVLSGLAVAREVARRGGLGIRFVAVMESLADEPPIRAIGEPVLVMKRHMLPPWLLPAGEERLPAGRPVPLGRRNGSHGTYRD
ncbi:MAG: cobalamin biosynthesis protein CbiA [Planctomycetes bacterium]|nr:cobalamin biosynthesis protein CbiA [Planctomycetota bacterium]